MKPRATISIRQLHDKTGEHVRAAGASRQPVGVTDRGKVVAVLGPVAAAAESGRKRCLLPEYEALLAAAPGPPVTDDLNAVRQER